MKKASKFLRLNWQDFAKSFLMAVGGAVFAVIAQSIQAGIWTFDWPTIWHTAVAAAVTYLGKNLFTPTPKIIAIDPGKTSVIDAKSKTTIINANNFKQ